MKKNQVDSTSINKQTVKYKKYDDHMTTQCGFLNRDAQTTVFHYLLKLLAFIKSR